ncbi:nicotinamidase-related amidase [Rhizobium sp. BK650]|uniref:cysteine hydrolase family protein n=1 Tax=Rhizobium sp. BK650 TaxID=2586990 RepID=UPI00161FADF0|nr:isochorismatase family cysteine hydrolase [Rhizobium sp. BK650]MBB3657018.1 nicotinamidase-related amidase [Rhizobium sp. BK650]
MCDSWIHLCIDMQRMFAEQTPWHVPWMATVSPQIVELAGRYPERTIFTRFMPPPTADAMPGMWKNYYKKWPMMTGEHLLPELMDIVADLKSFVPPARIFNKRTYSPWFDGQLHEILTREKVETIVITGGETDICVLAAALGAVDLGYRVILLKDAVCSSADETHDATLELLGGRFSVQVEITETDAFLSDL